MSEGLQIAKLFARIGFNIAEGDIQNVLSNLQQIGNKLNDLIKQAGEFATSLSQFSRGTNLSPELVQKFEKLGINARIGADGMRDIISASSELSRRSYWGFTNTLSQWGINLERADSAAQVFFKVMKGASGRSFQAQSEIFAAAGFPLEKAFAALDELSRRGFNTKNGIIIDKVTVDRLSDIDGISQSIAHNFKQFQNAFVGQQSERIKETMQRTEQIYSKVENLVLKMTGTDIFKKSFGMFYQALPVIDTVSENIGIITKAITGKLEIFKTIFNTIKAILGASILFKIVSILSGGGGFQILATLDETWKKLVGSSEAARAFQEMLKNGFLEAYKVLEEAVGKDWLKKLGIEKLKDDILDKGLFKVLDEQLSKLWKRLGDFLSSLLKFGKDVVSWLWDLATNRIDYFFTEFVMYARIAAIEALQQVRESAVGTRLGWLVGAPEDRNVVEWRKRQVFAEGTKALNDIELRGLLIDEQNPIRKAAVGMIKEAGEYIIERAGETVDDFRENPPPKKPISYEEKPQPEYDSYGPEGYEPPVVDATTGDLIRPGTDAYERYSVPSMSKRPVMQLPGGNIERNYNSKDSINVNVNQNNNVTVKDAKEAKEYTSNALNSEALKVAAVRTVQSQFNRRAWG